MSIGRKGLLETTLFDSQKVVTIAYLSRHAHISIDEARDELQSFYMENRDKSKLHAIYLISGRLNDESTNEIKQQNVNKPIECNRVQLVRDESLEKIKQNYHSVDTCEIFCLHSNSIKSLYSLYGIDHIDDDEYNSTDKERSWLASQMAEVKRDEMLKEHLATAQLLEKSAKQLDLSSSNSQSSKKHETVNHSKSITQKHAERNDISSLFKKAASKPKQATPVKAARESPFSTPTSEKKHDASENTKASESGQQKRRGRRILVDNEDQEEEKHILEERKKIKKEFASNETTDRKKSGDTNGEQSTSVKAIEKLKKEEKKRSIISSQDDLFSDDASSSPERMNGSEEGAEERQSTTLSSKRPRRSSRKLTPERKTTSTNDIKKKPTRKEHVTETFVDEDGFMVTKQVLKEVDVQSADEENTANSKKQVPLSQMTTQNIASDQPHANERTVAASKRTPHGQSKISAFFKKV